MSMPRRRTAFTLLEVLLVMAILLIIAAVCIPTMTAMFGDTKVRGAGDEVRYAMAEARARSIDNGVPYRFAKKPGTEKFRIAPDTSESWTSTGSNVSTDDDKSMEGSMPKGILFDADGGQGGSGNSTGDWTPVVVFLPDGSCKLPDGTTDKDATITVKPHDGGYSLIVRVRCLTGIITVKTNKQEDSR